jgi:hypothetical protein
MTPADKLRVLRSILVDELAKPKPSTLRLDILRAVISDVYETIVDDRSDIEYAEWDARIEALDRR